MIGVENLHASTSLVGICCKLITSTSWGALNLEGQGEDGVTWYKVLDPVSRFWRTEAFVPMFVVNAIPKVLIALC